MGTIDRISTMSMNVMTSEIATGSDSALALIMLMLLVVARPPAASFLGHANRPMGSHAADGQATRKTLPS